MLHDAQTLSGRWKRKVAGNQGSGGHFTKWSAIPTEAEESHLCCRASPELENHPLCEVAGCGCELFGMQNCQPGICRIFWRDTILIRWQESQGKTNKAGCKREPSCSPQGPFLKKPGMPWRSGSVSGWISQMPWCFLKSLYKFCEHVVEGHSIGWYFGWSDLLYWARSISAFASQITLHEPWAQSQQDYDFTMLHCSIHVLLVHISLAQLRKMMEHVHCSR